MDMDPKQYAEKAKADALAKGAKPEEADAIFAKAEAEAKGILEHPLYAGLATVNREISERATAIKKQLDEASPLIEAGKKALDAGKTTEEKLVTLTSERDKFKTVAESNEAAINAVLEREMAGLDDKQKALIPAGSAADRLSWLNKAKAAGVFGKQTASHGAELPFQGGSGARMKRADFVRLAPIQQMEFLKKGGSVED